MIWEKEFTENNLEAVCENLLDSWKSQAAKVFVLRAAVDFGCTKSIDIKVRDFYQKMFNFLGTPRAFAEDVRFGDRSKQRTGQIWMEVRYDPKFPDAYRHSANAQPLHTDGSYIPAYTNSTLLACVNNAGTGGETTFLDLQVLVSTLQEENSELLYRLRNTVVPHSRSGDSRESPILAMVNGKDKIYWNFHCVSDNATSDSLALSKEFFDYLASSEKIKSNINLVKLQRGDAVIWKDDELLHGRNSFVANNVSERFIWKCALDVGKF
jgi:alpha-ketoglutarate-dependent taurine dioxygenase